LILLKNIPLPKIDGIALWPFVLIASKEANSIVLNHERIHLRQQIEMLVLPFYVWYLAEWILYYFKFKDWDKAYRHISFEKEAYKNDRNLNYLKTRRFWGFLKYLG
jgi:hypothetical protein